MARCRHCKDKFNPKYSSLQKFCMVKDECIKAHVNYAKEQKAKLWRKGKKEKKESLKTRSERLKDLQVIFNRFIRLRDEGGVCISCQKPCKKKNAGHYRSVGSNPELRFEELNCFLQCEHCNTYLHGNLINYRINLIKKIGVEKVDWLEGKHDLKRYSDSDIVDLTKKYKEKAKLLLQGC